MLRAVSDSLYQFLINAFPADRPYTRSSFEREPMPMLISHFLVQTLQHRIDKDAEPLRIRRSDWMAVDHPEVQQAYKSLAGTLARHGQIPREEWTDTLRRACKLVTAHLVLPTHTVAEFIFKDETGVLPAHVINRQLGYFAAYGYLREAVEAFMKRRDLNEIDRGRFEALLVQIDRHMTAGYSSDQWVRLLKPFFELRRQTDPQGKAGVPIDLLCMFFGEKEADALQQRLQAARDQQGVTELDENRLRHILNGSMPRASSASSPPTKPFGSTAPAQKKSAAPAAPKPVAHPSPPKPVTQPSPPKPVANPSPKPVVQSSPPKPLAQPAPRPVANPAPPKPVANPAPKPFANPVPKPVAHPAPPKPVANPAPKPFANPSPKPVAQPLPPKPVVHPSPKPMANPAPPKPVANPAPKPFANPAPSKPVANPLPPVAAPVASQRATKPMASPQDRTNPGTQTDNDITIVLPAGGSLASTPPGREADPVPVDKKDGGSSASALAEGQRPEPAKPGEDPVPLWMQFRKDGYEPAAGEAETPDVPQTGNVTSQQQPVPLWMQFRGDSDAPPEAGADETLFIPAPSGDDTVYMPPLDADDTVYMAPVGGGDDTVYMPPYNADETVFAQPMGLDRLENDVLGPMGAGNRDMFVDVLFSGSRPAYEHVLRRLQRTPTWREATQLIADEVFKKHRVNIYSPAAVLFTESVEGTFRTPS